jgi:hypothetical protein
MYCHSLLKKFVLFFVRSEHVNVYKYILAKSCRPLVQDKYDIQRRKRKHAQ